MEAQVLQQLPACVMSSCQAFLMQKDLNHVHNVEKRFYCPQTFLSLNLQCRDDVSELKFGIEKSAAKDPDWPGSPATACMVEQLSGLSDAEVLLQKTRTGTKTSNAA